MPRRSAAAATFPIRPTERLRPPADLAGPEKDLFLDLVVSCEPGHFTRSDLPLLCAFVRACCLEQTASSELAAAGFVDEGKASPWLAILAQATRSMSVLSRLLRLNPIARRETAPAVEEAVSYYERQALLEGRREPDEPN